MALSDADKGILSALRQHGDTLSKPREITHWAYFESDEARLRFVERCTNAGFEVRGVNDGAPGSKKFSVRFAHTDIPNEGAVELFGALLTKMALECGGEYDGWETQVQ
jgi:hypothetical protein